MAGLLAGTALVSAPAATASSWTSPQTETAETHTLGADAPDSIHRYYDEGGERLWSGFRDRRRLRGLIETLASLRDVGIDPEQYGLSELQEAMDSRRDDGVEAAASIAYTTLAADLSRGRLDPLITYTEEEVAERDLARTELLRDLARTGSVEEALDALRSDNPVQQGLLRTLKTYEAYAEEEAWTPIEIGSETLEEGATGPDVAAVEKRLAAEGFYTIPRRRSDETPTYGPELARAVEAFQISRGIAEDGVIGPNTLRRMNETPSELVRTIQLNLERARWLPADFGDRFIMVNIAGFNVTAWEEDEAQFSIRTVVGDLYHKTPVFADEMEYVVANPYWNIPASIVSAEIAPKQASDPNYLANNNMEVVSSWDADASIIDPSSINWSSVTGGESWRVRQRGGPSNALGLIKFMFPNKYAVYLHDSPAESLFDRPERAFSHGCIRVADPYKLADWVLEGTEWDGRERELIDSGTRRQVSLAKTIPVYISYFTAINSPGGEPRFYDDIYDRDDELAQAFENNRAQIKTQMSALID